MSEQEIKDLKKMGFSNPQVIFLSKLKRDPDHILCHSEKYILDHNSEDPYYDAFAYVYTQVELQKAKLGTLRSELIRQNLINKVNLLTDLQEEFCRIHFQEKVYLDQLKWFLRLICVIQMFPNEDHQGIHKIITEVRALEKREANLMKEMSDNSTLLYSILFDFRVNVINRLIGRQ